MDVLTSAVVQILLEIINIYWWILIISAVLSWLIAFGVVNTHNRVVATIADVLFRLTEPVLRPIRNMLPAMGGIDISPLVLMIGLIFLEKLIYWLYFQIFM